MNTARGSLEEEGGRMDRQFWLKGGWLTAGRYTLQAWGVFLFLRRLVFALLFLSGVGLMLWLAWAIPHSTSWRFTVAPFLQANPPVVVVLIVSLVLPLFWLLLWKLPQWQVTAVPEVKDRLDLESKSRQTLAQMVGGAALLVGLYFTAQTLRTTQQGQITDRFTKAIDQLGKDTLAVRLGGIYALERIARDSESDHWAVMEVLTAFIREHPPEKDTSKPPPDIQAILTVIGRRTSTWQDGEMLPIDLHAAQLGTADLQGAKFAEANLQRADLQEANLQRANLQRADLQEANLQRANLQRANLQRANLQGANLQGASLPWASLPWANLQGANLRVANLQEANLQRAKLQGADLLGADLLGADLQRASLPWANLQGANLRVANLQGADLQGADLQGAYLQEADLQRTFLGEANLQRANLQGVYLEGATLQGANFQGANLSEAKNLTRDQVQTACGDINTRLPDNLKGLTPPPCPE
jgi:uncharacterized protein YjbI with pentapeptide repeats